MWENWSGLLDQAGFRQFFRIAQIFCAPGRFLILNECVPSDKLCRNAVEVPLVRLLHTSSKLTPEIDLKTSMRLGFTPNWITIPRVRRSSTLIPRLSNPN